MELGEQRLRHETEPVVTDRVFGLVLGGVNAILATWPMLFGRQLRLPFLMASLSLIAAATLCPKLLHWPKVGWLAVTTRVAQFVSFVLVSVMFFGVVTPVSLLLRLLRRDALRLSREPDASSYWIPRQSADATASMKNQY